MQSRKPPPLPSKLIKSDPDSATSPSKYSEPGSKSPVSANQKTAMPESSDAASEAGAGAKKKVFRKKMKKKKQSVVSEDEGGPPRRPKHLDPEVHLVHLTERHLVHLESPQGEELQKQDQVSTTPLPLLPMVL